MSPSLSALLQGVMNWLRRGEKAKLDPCLWWEDKFEKITAL